MLYAKLLRILLAFLVSGGILLLLDLENSQHNRRQPSLQIALYKTATRKALEETETGILLALEARGYSDGKKCTISRFSAEGDMALANTIAGNIANNRYDMVITIGTPALQTMAHANQKGKVTHVFCTVTDPYNAGVGITGSAPSQHPRHLVGVGTFQPVEKAFQIARQMNPGLRKTGVVWCTGESCSEACVLKARKICGDLDIELLEAGIENSTQVLEMATALCLRGAEALWVGGDNTVEAAIDQVVTAASRAGIPVFTNNPSVVYGNILFAVGAEYQEVGNRAGHLAADILEGKSPLEIGVENIVPEKLVVNPGALEAIRSTSWNLQPFL